MSGYKMAHHFTTACGVTVRLNQLPIHFHGMVLTPRKIPHPPPPNISKLCQGLTLAGKVNILFLHYSTSKHPFRKRGAGITEG